MSEKIDKLRILIARNAVLFGLRSRKATGEKLVKLNVALNLLTQAQLVALSSENEAKKLNALAMSIANSEAQDEQRSQKPGRNGSVHQVRETSSPK